jgi:hypothetical protein
MNDASRGRQRPADMGVDMFQMSVDPSSQGPRALIQVGFCRAETPLDDEQRRGAGQRVR